MHSRPIYQRLAEVRQASVALAEPLSDADATAQSMPDASPAKWHLAHTTWFFEAMVLEPHLPGYERFHESFHFLFNSYYESLGERHERPRRGLLTRPSLTEVLAYRKHVDAQLDRLSTRATPAILKAIELGCHHEQQHQELLLTDILHLFAQNPLAPAYCHDPHPPVSTVAAEQRWLAFDGGLHEIGHADDGFAFDCELPRHPVYLAPYRLAQRLVTNHEWLAFMRDGGYRNPLLWLSDGWATVNREGWQAPLYWQDIDDHPTTMTLFGRQPVNPAAPVTHISFYEADAFARWSGRRLPTEAEWEHAASSLPRQGNFDYRQPPQPAPIDGDPQRLQQMFGDVWEWTASPFTPYPGFRTPDGPVGEYNGKFMSGQWVLRGGSCATPANHIRASYRNFFPPHARWQFKGMRLAEDLA